MCSVAASMATMIFNRILTELVDEYNETLDDNSGTLDEFAYCGALLKAVNKGAMFDARCFNIPEDEVVNCFVWRQQDATRNAIQMLGQCNFSNKELEEKSCDEIQEMLMTRKGINFNDMPTEFKRGVCCIKEEYYPEPMPGYEDCEVDATSVRTRWVLDKEIPIFTQDRNYIENTFKGVL
jgi:tRNA(His) 5'-end guanylyltransferase